MAYAAGNISRAQTGLTDRVSALLIDIRARMARRKVFRDTLSELQGLTDRELADLGIVRAELRRIAHTAAYEM